VNDTDDVIHAALERQFAKADRLVPSSPPRASAPALRRAIPVRPRWAGQRGGAWRLAVVAVVGVSLAVFGGVFIGGLKGPVPSAVPSDSPSASAPVISSAAPSGPSSPKPQPSATLSGPAAAFVTAVEAIPSISHDRPPDGAGLTRGAFGAVVAGAFGSVTLAGQGQCVWDPDVGTPEGMLTDQVRLLGEAVSIHATIDVLIDRGDDHAKYRGNGTSTGPMHARDATWLQVTGLQVDELVSSDPGTAAFNEPLAGRADAAELAVTIAWRCDAFGTGPSPAPTATPRPTVYPWPTPACPPTQQGAPTWKLLLGIGSDVATGVPGSAGFQTCTTAGDVDGGFHDPDTGATLTAPGRLTLRLDGESTLFQIGSATYSAWGTSGQIEGPLGTYTPTPGVYEVDAPPTGDWTVVVGASINDVARGTVVSQTWYFRITVLP
jgi:hypothetical protein